MHRFPSKRPIAAGSIIHFAHEIYILNEGHALEADSCQSNLCFAPSAATLKHFPSQFLHPFPVQPYTISQDAVTLGLGLDRFRFEGVMQLTSPPLRNQD